MANMNERRPTAPEGYDAQERGIVLRDERVGSDGGSRMRLLLGLMWTLIGVACLVQVPVVSCLLIAFGLAVALVRRTLKQQVVVALGALAVGCSTIWVLAGIHEVPSAAASLVCSLAVAWTYVEGRGTVGSFLLLTAAVTCAMIGIDTVTTSLAGTTIPETIALVVDAVIEGASSSLDLGSRVALLDTRNDLMAFWPTVYFSVALGMTLCSYVGARRGFLTCGGEARQGNVTSYDVPLWVALVFVVGVVIRLLGGLLPAGAQTATMVGDNVVMCTRFALALQGLSVLQWWLHEHGIGRFARVFAALAGAWLELSYVLMSVVGLVDVCVNFRRLERGRADLVLWPTRES